MQGRKSSIRREPIIRVISEEFAERSASAKTPADHYAPSMVADLKKLKKQERLLLLQFVCAFAWADLEVRDEERQFVARLVRRMDLEPDEVKKVDGWLKLPPKPEEIDPNRVPRVHRELFIECARQVIASDGRIDPAERENLELFKQLV